MAVMEGKWPETKLGKFKLPFEFVSVAKGSKPKTEPQVTKPRGKFDPPGPVTKEQLARLQNSIASQKWKRKLSGGPKGVKRKGG